MNAIPLNKKLVTTLSIYLLLLVVLIVLSDWGIRTSIEKAKVVKLNSQATSDLSSEQLKYQKLIEEVSDLKKVVSAKEKLRYPTLKEIKNKASEFRLKLRQVEKGSQGSQNDPQKIKYLASFVGSMSSVVYFLRDIESAYLLETDGLVLKAADDKGENLVMTISLLVSE